MTEPTWQTPDGAAQLYLGDCLEVMPGLGKVDAVVTDPPYGIGWCFSGQGSGTRAQGGKESVTKGKRIRGDTKEFNPSPFMNYKSVILWGFHHYPQRLHRGTVLIWIKKYPNAYGTFLSDADLAWMNSGCGVYISETINPASFQKEKIHPTQKPIVLMAWCLSFIPKAEIILDPYMGSGTTGCACMQLGRRFIGIEIEKKYFEIAKDRIQTAWEDAQNDLFKNQQQEILEQGSIFE